MVRPKAAIFGKKDYQQCIVLKNMVRQLALPIDIILAETVRAPDGLALSSRNGYLSQEERVEAVSLYRTLSKAKEQVAGGKTQSLDTQVMGMVSSVSLGASGLSLNLYGMDPVSLSKVREIL